MRFMSEERIVIPESCRFTAYEMTQYILKAFAFEDASATRNEHTFKMYGYAGSLKDLFVLVDEIATSEGKIQKCIDVPRMAWGCGWNRMNPGADTNLNYAEVDLFMERVHYLLNQMVIGPGNARDVSADLPWIHLTEYGKKCIEERDILPYDTDGYIAKIQSCSRHTVWDVYYIQQILGCFNRGLYDAATMMLGIEGEYLAGHLIRKYTEFLAKNEPTEQTSFEAALRKCNGKISKEYEEYSKSWRHVSNKKDTQNNLLYPNLAALKQRLDQPAESTFMNYLRLTRNGLAHPSNTVMEPSETMLLIVSFLKYFEIQNEYLEFFYQHS